jgi:hypothetical protein
MAIRVRGSRRRDDVLLEYALRVGGCLERVFRHV